MKFKDLVVGPSNEIAVKAAELIVQKPGKEYPVLFLLGKHGTGKSTVIRAIVDAFEGNVIAYTGQQLMNDYIEAVKQETYKDFYRKLCDCDLLIVDDLHEITKMAATQDLLYFLIKERTSSAKQIVISSTQMPPTPQFQETFLELINASLITPIQKPNFEERLLITRHMAKERGLELYDDVIHYIAEKFTSSLNQIKGALIKLEASSKLLNHSINVEFAKEHL